MNIRDVPAILKDYNITEEDFKKYVDNLPLFRRILEAAVIDWNAAGTTHERLKIEAAITLEAGLKHIGARMVKDDEDLGKAVEAAKLLANIAGVGKEKNDAGPSDKFSIVINIGEKKFTKEITSEVRPVSEGAGEAIQIQALPAPTGSTEKV